MSTGRYFIIDEKTGRRFCVEPISQRNEKLDDKIFKNGGVSGNAVKNKSDIQGGSIYEEDSIITPENGYATQTMLPAGMSPNDYVEMLCRTGKKINE